MLLKLLVMISLKELQNRNCKIIKKKCSKKLKALIKTKKIMLVQVKTIINKKIIKIIIIIILIIITIKIKSKTKFWIKFYLKSSL